jgi:hypothetical protein
VSIRSVAPPFPFSCRSLRLYSFAPLRYVGAVPLYLYL